MWPAAPPSLSVQQVNISLCENICKQVAVSCDNIHHGPSTILLHQTLLWASVTCRIILLDVDGEDDSGERYLTGVLHPWLLNLNNMG